MVLNPSIKKAIAGGAAPVIASYDWVDIATGTGYREYYGGMLAVSSSAIASTALYLLSNNIFPSNKVSTIGWYSSTGGGEGYVKQQDLDFDVTFKLPQIVKGKGIFIIPHGTYSTQAGKNFRNYIHVKVRKWDGTTETEIAAASGGIIYTKSAPCQHQSAIEIELPRRIFKADETLRVTIEHYMYFVQAATQASFAIGHDPKDRAYTQNNEDKEFNWASASSVLSCQIPFEIDI